MPVTRKQVEEGREANVAQRAKRSTASNRLVGGPPFRGVSLVVPLKYCVSDNQRVMLMRNQRRIVSHPEYRAAKNVIQGIARRAMGEVQPTDEPVEWRAVVHFENNRRDLMNAAKLLADSLNGIVYRDDKQIKRAVWEWGEQDKENPRVELTIQPREAA